jgi:hypothetical protein
MMSFFISECVQDFILAIFFRNALNRRVDTVVCACKNTELIEIGRNANINIIVTIYINICVQHLNNVRVYSPSRFWKLHVHNSFVVESYYSSRDPPPPMLFRETESHEGLGFC